jgi:phosphoribosylanthranilate isomerase
MSNPIQFDDFIQIAGVRDLEEAQLLMDCGVRYVGFPLRLRVNQEDLSEKDAAAIIHAIQPGACGIAITYQNDADDIAEFMGDLGASVIQLHGDISVRELERLRELRPTIKVIKSLVVGERGHDDLVTKARLLGRFVDSFITDTFDPSTGASGATGKTHDWRISRQLVDIAQKPVVLAGGLTPENVREAILFVRPAGVDAHTGVEDASGRKDAVKIRAFVAAARAAFRLLRANTVRRG